MSLSLKMNSSALRFGDQKLPLHTNAGPHVRRDRRQTLSKTIELSISSRLPMTNSQQPIAGLLSWRRFCRRSACNLSSIKHRIRPQMRWLRREQLLFAIDQVRGTEGRQLEPVAMGNRICRAGFHAISAKNAAVVINVIDLGVAFRATDPLFGRVFCRLDVNAVGRAIRRT